MRRFGWFKHRRVLRCRGPHGYLGRERTRQQTGRSSFSGSRCCHGRKIDPAYLFEVKKPAESEQEWDFYKLIGTTPAEEAFPTSQTLPPQTRISEPTRTEMHWSTTLGMTGVGSQIGWRESASWKAPVPNVDRTGDSGGYLYSWVYYPEALTWWKRSTTAAIEWACGLLPYPWGDRTEASVGGFGLWISDHSGDSGISPWCLASDVSFSGN